MAEISPAHKEYLLYRKILDASWHVDIINGK